MNVVQRAAAALLAARRDERQFEAPASPPEDAAQAYAIQEAVLRELGPARGWKVGAASPEAEPNRAPLLAVESSPAELDSARFHMLGIEAEIAFTLAADLPPRDSDYARGDVVAAIASAHAAIEVVDTRFCNWRAAHALWKLADNQSNGSFVHAPGIARWQHIDFTRQPVALYAGDEKLCETVGGNSAGDPLRLLVWLANHLARRGTGLQRGDVITTGSCTGMRFVEPGSRVRAEFPGVGTAQVHFTVE